MCFNVTVHFNKMQFTMKGLERKHNLSITYFNIIGKFRLLSIR